MEIRLREINAANRSRRISLRPSRTDRRARRRRSPLGNPEHQRSAKLEGEFDHPRGRRHHFLPAGRNLGKDFDRQYAGDHPAHDCPVPVLGRDSPDRERDVPTQGRPIVFHHARPPGGADTCPVFQRCANPCRGAIGIEGIDITPSASPRRNHAAPLSPFPAAWSRGPTPFS